jgi:hypothetical protein
VEAALGEDLDFSKLGLGESDMQEAQKIFEDCFKQMGGVKNESTDMSSNPFLMACSQMFKDFEHIQKEGEQ